jgi:drug/metabolite transporter (DMT)-like permease
LIYVAIFARLVWGERIQRLEMAGMAVALAAVALINAG